MQSNSQFLMADSQHAVVLAALHRAIFLDKSWSETAWKTFLISDQHQAWIALNQDDVPFGCLLIQRVGPEVEILTFGIDPSFTKRGHGQWLLDQGLTWMKDAGIETCLLEVASKNAAAIHLYAKNGFVQVGRRAGYYQVKSKSDHNAGHLQTDDAVLMKRTF